MSRKESLEELKKRVRKDYNDGWVAWKLFVECLNKIGRK